MLPSFLVSCLLFAAQTSALVTLSNMRELTNLARESRERIVNATTGDWVDVRKQAVLPGGRHVDGHPDDDAEIEDVGAVCSLSLFSLCFISSASVSWKLLANVTDWKKWSRNKGLRLKRYKNTLSRDQCTLSCVSYPVIDMQGHMRLNIKQFANELLRLLRLLSTLWITGFLKFWTYLSKQLLRYVSFTEPILNHHCPSRTGEKFLVTRR